MCVRGVEWESIFSVSEEELGRGADRLQEDGYSSVSVQSGHFTSDT